MRGLVLSADNTIFSETTLLGQQLSNGAGPHFYVGSNRIDGTRRGLIRVDLSAIPLGSTVNSAELRLNISQAGFGGFSQIDVYRTAAAWGEGASDAGSPGGQGAIAVSDDATWQHRFFDTQTWATPGGDFAATPTVSLTPGNIGSISVTGISADVQSWLDGQTVNHGWLLKLATEGVAQTALRFDSRENTDPAVQPKLLLNFRGGGDTNADDIVNISDFATLAANFNQPLFGPDNGDFNRTNLVDISDFAILAANFNQNFAARPVPEMTTAAWLLVGATFCARSRSGVNKSGKGKDIQ